MKIMFKVTNINALHDGAVAVELEALPIGGHDSITIHGHLIVKGMDNDMPRSLDEVFMADLKKVTNSTLLEIAKHA